MQRKKRPSRRGELNEIFQLPVVLVSHRRHPQDMRRLFLRNSGNGDVTACFLEFPFPLAAQ